MKLTNLHKICISIALFNASDGAISTILPPFLHESGQTVERIGLIVSIFSVLALASRIPGALMYKPQRANLIMRAFTLLYAISLPFYAVVGDATGVTLVRAFGGFTFGVATTLNLAILMDVLSSTSNRARATAFYAASMSAGFAVGNSAGGWIADTLGYQWAFALSAITPAIIVVLSLDGAHEKPAVESASEKHLNWAAKLQSTFRYIWSPSVLVIALLAFSLNANHYLATTFFPLYLTAIGMGLTSIGLLRAVHSFFGMITRPFSGEATRFFSNESLANVGLALAGGLVVLIPSFDSMITLVPLFVVMGTARGIVMVSNQISLTEAAGDDPRKRGMLSGTFNIARDLGCIFGPIFGGVLAGVAGIENMLRIGPSVLLLAYFAVFIIVSRQRSAQPKVEAGEGVG